MTGEEDTTTETNDETVHFFKLAFFAHLYQPSISPAERPKLAKSERCAEENSSLSRLTSPTSQQTLPPLTSSGSKSGIVSRSSSVSLPASPAISRENSVSKSKSRKEKDKKSNIKLQVQLNIQGKPHHFFQDKLWFFACSSKLIK